LFLINNLPNVTLGDEVEYGAENFLYPYEVDSELGGAEDFLYPYEVQHGTSCG
jgi:hypothetical protein